VSEGKKASDCLSTVAAPLCRARLPRVSLCGVILLGAFSFDRDITKTDAPNRPHAAATARIPSLHRRIDPFGRSRRRMTRR
jgi:hypothetical protein